MLYDVAHHFHQMRSCISSLSVMSRTLGAGVALLLIMACCHGIAWLPLYSLVAIIVGTILKILSVLAVIINLETVRARWLLFCTLASALLTVDTVVLRALLGSYSLILASL